jgi:hypothetical protein
MTWPWVMHIPHRQHHVAQYGVKRHSRSGADNESRTRGLGHGVAALFQLSYIRKICKTDLRPVSRSSCSNLLKSICRCRQRDPVIAGLRRCAGRCGETENKKARILSESGPLRTELGGCAARRCPLPDASGPRPDQAADGPRIDPAAEHSCNRQTSSPSA